MGRTATKWLAQALDVPYEPMPYGEDFPLFVSPAHLDLVRLDAWSPPEGTKIGIIRRQPEHQLLSIINRRLAIGLPVDPARMVSVYSMYLIDLQQFFEEGAEVMDYEKLTEDTTDFLAQIAWIPQELLKNIRPCFEHRVNTLPKSIVKLPPWAMDLALKIGETYDRW